MRLAVLAPLALALAIAACSGSLTHEEERDAGATDAAGSGGDASIDAKAFDGAAGSNGGAPDASDGNTGTDTGTDAGCTSSSDCSAPTAACVVGACVGGECQTQNTPLGTPCTSDALSGVCDGNGACVECNTDADCTPDATCTASECVPITCTDGAKNGTESDVDCGGGTCPACADGLSCNAGADCATGFCDPVTGKCAPCTANSNCQDPSKPLCALGLCGPLKIDGAQCSTGADCSSGHCVDGVCCVEASCGPSECFVCNASGFEGSCHVANSGKACTSGKCDGQGVCATGDCLWSKGSSNLGNQYGHSIAVDATGNVLVTGELNETLDFGCTALTSAGAADVFIAKFDNAGACLWSKRAGDSGAQYGTGVVFDQSGNGYVVGQFGGSIDFGCGPMTSAGSLDAFVAKLDPSGTCIWSKRAGDLGYQRPWGVALDGAGNVVLTGDFVSSMDFGCTAPISGNGSTFLTKLDPSGACVWMKSANYSEGWAVAADAAGNVYAAGQFSASLTDFGCGPLPHGGAGDGFVVKLDAMGSCVWSKAIGGSGTDDALNLTVDDAGHVYVTGYSYGVVDAGCGPMASGGSADAFAAKLDPQGACLWSKQAGGALGQFGRGVAVDKSGNLIVAGQTSGTLDLGCGPVTNQNGIDAFVAKLSPHGACLWTKNPTGNSHTQAHAVVIDPIGNVLVTGQSSGAADFGCGPVTSLGTVAFIAKLAP